MSFTFAPIQFDCAVPTMFNFHFFAANMQQDVFHVYGVHCDTVALLLEVIKQTRHEVHPLLHCRDIDVT